MFKNKIRTYCRQKELFAKGDRILVGLSGGADSVCLFLVLLSMAKEWELSLVPVHVNHNLRGAEADRDQKFCEELCRQHNLELLVESMPVAELAAKKGWTLEEAGRNARYEVFRKWKERQRCDKIAVAHHKNDQAETVLFQLLRGSRLKGLSGIQAKNKDIIRPLLCVSREEIEEYLTGINQNYCIDRTNLEEEYTRNKIRHRMIPLAEELQPKAVEHITETAEYLGKVEKLLQSLTEELFAECVTDNGCQGITLKIAPLERAEGLLAERVVYETLCLAFGEKKDITAGFVTDCMGLLQKQTGRYLTLKDGVVVRRQPDSLWFGRMREAAESYREEILEFPYQTMLPENGYSMTLTVEPVEKIGKIIPKNTYTKWFDYDKIRKVILLRTPETEDVIALYRDGRGKRVLDVLKEAKVPLEKRKTMRLLTAGNEVLWIPGIRGSEGYHVTEETKQVLIATINGGNEDGR